MKPSDLTLNFQTLAHSDTALAVGATPYYNYVDGKPGDTPAGIRIETVLTGFKYEKISVKLEGIKHPITPESFDNENTTFKVRFSPDFQAKFYRTQTGEYALSCKASTVEVVK